MLDPSGAQPDALGSERSIARCARLQAQDMGRPAPGRAHVNPVWAPGHSQVRPPSGLDGREPRRRTRPSSVPARGPCTAPPPLPLCTSSSGAQRETARSVGSLLSPPCASWPDLPKSPPVGARPAASRPGPLTPGRVFCSCSALWAFSADSRSQ